MDNHHKTRAEKKTAEASSPDHLKICSINICGMSDRSSSALEKYCFDHSLDVVGIQEAATANKNKLHLANMEMIQDTNAAKNKGCALYVNSGRLSITQVDSISQLSKNIDSAWGLVTGKHCRYIIGTVYLKLNYKNAVEELMKMLAVAHQTAKTMHATGVILMGDLNARSTLWGDTTENSYGKKLVNQLEFQNFSIISSDKPTFLSTNGCSNIDLLITSNDIEHSFSDIKTDELAILHAGAPTMGHVPILTTLQLAQAEPPEKKSAFKIDLTTMNWPRWTSYIENELNAKEDEFKTYDAYKHWTAFDELLQLATAENSETKQTTIHDKPYWNKALTDASDELKDAKWCYMKRNTTPNRSRLAVARENFEAIRKEECQRFILEKTENLNAAQARDFWKQFNRIFKKKTSKKVAPLKSAEGSIIVKEEEMDEYLFATFFEGKHLQEKGDDFDTNFFNSVNTIYDTILEDQKYPEPASTTTSPNPREELNREISRDEVKNTIRSYKCSGKSFDNHQTHPTMLKHLGSNALSAVTDLFNKCKETGHWVWDTADVIFLKKEGKKSYSDPGAYRPISITSYVGKVNEKIMNARLEIFFNQMLLHDPTQEGFTKKKNTVRYLNRLDSSIRKNLSKKETVICLFIDFEKAFDSVWKKGLMKKLYDYGVDGQMWNLINSFLFTRKVKLMFNGYVGIIRCCREFGLPQGSALSPILFKIFLHDLGLDLINLSNVDVYKFAEDGTIQVVGRTTSECLETLELVCRALHKWSTTWRMIINCNKSKTELICFGTAEKRPDLIPEDILIGQNKIHFVTQTTVLGLTMDKDLTYKAHAESVKDKCLVRWINICKYSNRNWGFRQHVLVRLIEVLVSTCIHYAGTIWINPRSIRELEPLWYKMIKSAIGAVFNVSLCLGEIILGIPPITITNKLNSIKHLLKINISQIPDDPLRDMISQHLMESNVRTFNRVKEAFLFLQWKLIKTPEDFSNTDTTIVSSGDIQGFSYLSDSSCSYTKTQIQHYTEELWQKSVNNQYCMDGQVSTTLKYNAQRSDSQRAPPGRRRHSLLVCSTLTTC